MKIGFQDEKLSNEFGIIINDLGKACQDYVNTTSTKAVQGVRLDKMRINLCLATLVSSRRLLRLTTLNLPTVI